MGKKTIQLSGYFDNNFGDDYMMKIIVHSLPDIDFVIDENENANPVLLEEQNVRREKLTNDSKYEKLVVTGCGFMINSKVALLTEMVHFLKRHNPGDYCLGCNIEPLDSFIKRYLIVNKLNKFKLIVCRDKKSLSFMKKHVKRPQKEQLPDILFGMPSSWLPQKKDGNKLGIAMMHRSGDTEDCRYYKAMASVADHWIEENDSEVVLMAFDSGIENDLYACECVKSLMKHPEKVKISVHKNGGEIFDAYSECSKIIGARFHSAVLAIKMGLPLFPIVYREKMKNLIDDLAYPERGCAIDEIDETSLHTFLTEAEKPYHLEKEVPESAERYGQLLEQLLRKNSNNE